MPIVRPVLPSIVSSPLACWYIQVCVADPLFPDEAVSFALGPVESWSRARGIAAKWEQEHGENTALVSYREPGTKRFANPLVGRETSP
jgi:hypothetical protein